MVIVYVLPIWFQHMYILLLFIFNLTIYLKLLNEDYFLQVLCI